jgi:NAD(P)-dependent dehydrogenase (short-subunit alcohol dehydrogenase family)
VEAICGEGHTGVFDRTDVSREEEVTRMIGDTVARWGRIDILFNNAGVVLVKPLEETTEAEWDRVMSINLRAAFLTIKHVVPHLRRAGLGAILNTGSIGSIVGQLKTPAYIQRRKSKKLKAREMLMPFRTRFYRSNVQSAPNSRTPNRHLGCAASGLHKST